MSELTPSPFSLRSLTPARVSLARTGSSLATAELLDFSLAHAQARDAVYTRLEVGYLMEELRSRTLDPVSVQSAATDRSVYIRRPDLGRILSDASRGRLQQTGGSLTIILADGLSALATNRHAPALLDALLPRLHQRFTLTQAVVAEHARVALGDEVGALLHSELTVMLIGERPGLSSPDSLGAYLTWSPRSGRTDAERNCVSNIRPEGLDYSTAAARIASLCLEAAERRLTGTALKERALPPLLP